MPHVHKAASLSTVKHSKARIDYTLCELLTIECLLLQKVCKTVLLQAGRLQPKRSSTQPKAETQHKDGGSGHLAGCLCL